MTEWHLYSLDDGRLLGRSFSAPGTDADDEDVALNTPAGCGVVAGVSDWQSQKVDLDTGRLVDFQPPPPADDAMRTWEWHWVARRWVPVETDLAVAMRVRAERDLRLAASDWTDTASAPARLGGEVYAAWQAYRQALRDVTEQSGFPRAVVWPVKPGSLA